MLRVFVKGVTVANDLNGNRETSPAVSLFQKAHSRMTSLQRLDEQLASLLDQRKKIQEELRTIQSLINEEFDRVMKQAGEMPNRVLSMIADGAKDGNGHGNGGAGSRLEVSEVLS